MRLTGEAITILAMALSTLALGTALYLHVGFAPWAAIATALAAYIGMLGVHAMMPRHLMMQYEGADIGGPNLAPMSFGAEPARAPPMPPRAPLATNRKPAPEMKLPPEPRPAPEPALAPQQAKSAEPRRPREAMLPQGQRPAPEATLQLDPRRTAGSRPESARPTQPTLQHSPARGATPVAAADPAGGRPKSTEPAMTPPRLPEAAPAAMAPPSLSVPPAAPAPREADVEMIQGLIKKLADEVNAASASPPKNAEAAAKISEKAITNSVDALKTAAGSMRSLDQAVAQRPACEDDKAASERATESGRPAAVNARLSALAEALALGRVEVLLDPIVDFSVQRPRHFEVYVRLRDESGKVLDTEEAKDELAGTGMLPRLDGARLSSASQIAMHFSGRAGVLFSTVSGEALGANKFLDGVAQAYRERQNLAGQLIMTFSQADVRGFGAREWRALADFASLGFRYGIGDVSDLEMDFENLKARGFEFVKLDADVFLKGLPAGNDVFIPAADVCKHVAGLGLSVIVGRMADEHAAAKIFGFGVLYGQGTLFGSAKAVKREVLSSKGHAAA
jgi:cyclic-di-GMP phosphodiesterase, flagellum assembly factor TipF